jgi:glycosyltransferase involved in cell wall biosynthesis
VKRRLIVVGPLPPPYHGVTISTELVLANAELRSRFDVAHVDTSDHRANSNVGRWDWTNLMLGFRDVTRLLSKLRGPHGVVYLPLSQSTPGFLRDSLFIRVAASRNWKVAVHLRGSDFSRFYEGAPAPLRFWMRQTLAHVSAVGVMGETLRHVFAGLVRDELIEVVPNGTPPPEANGVVRDPRRVLFLSNLRRRKGVVEAVEAALLVLEEHDDVRFVFAGAWEDHELERSLRQRTKIAGDRLEFREPVAGPDKDALLASSALLVFPPTAPEGHPRVVLEALAAGLPVVATDRGAILETLIDGETGFVLPDADPGEIARRISALLRDGDLRRRMSDAAHKRYLDHFTQEQADRRLAGWLERVALERDLG